MKIFDQIYIIVKVVLFSSLLLSDNSIKESLEYKISRLLHDSGYNWEYLSVFGDARFKNRKENNYINNTVSIQLSDKYISSRFLIKTQFKDYYHADVFGIFGKQNLNTGYFTDSGQLISSKNIDKILISYSSFGYINEWFSFQVIKGSENWGAGEKIDLALSNSSNPYTYFRLGSNYGRLRVKYIHGVLSSYSGGINRYIIGRGIEWTNNNNYILGFSETVIYSGNNRPLDIAYLNPISSHIEIELNNRLNTVGNSNSNAVWQLHNEFLYKKKIRISFNMLLDELVLDKRKEVGKENGIGHSLRIAFSILNRKNLIINFYLKNITVGTPTFRHNNGDNNFIHNTKPIGFNNGSDCKDTSIGINLTNRLNFFLDINCGIFLSGEENILNRIRDPYLDYLKGDFPSGNIDETFYVNVELNQLIRSNIALDFNLHFKNKKNIFELSIIVPIF